MIIKIGTLYILDKLKLSNLLIHIINRLATPDQLELKSREAHLLIYIFIFKN